MKGAENMITKTHTGYCPFLNKEHTISIEYLEVSQTQTTHRHFKRSKYECCYSDECPPENLDEYGRCPLYLECPDSLRL